MLRKIRNKIEKITESKFLEKHSCFLKLMIVSFIVLSSWVQLQFSCINSIILFRVDIKYIFLNILTLNVLLSIIFIVTDTLWVSCLLFSIFTFLVSAVNYYTIQLHGSPLTVSELANLKTALNVIGGYELKLREIFLLFVIFIFECALCFFLKGFRKKGIKKLKNIVARDIILCMVSAVTIFACYLKPNPYMPQLNYLSWRTAYLQYGYMPCTIAAAYASMDIAKKPDGYDKGCVNNIEIKRTDYSDNETPDIILILNETFYDLSLITDLKTDVPYMENISSMENVIRGYAVNPAGGTNPSEYELLTSNSMKLMHGKVPFNVLDMKDANSIIRHLEQVGYHTIGAHGAPSANYNRGRAYGAMGFDEAYFIDDFTHKKYFGDRKFITDECMYENLLSWYGQCGDGPRFAYLMTIQNHGGWEANEGALDTVHAENDFGEYDEEVDEYLSCIRLSDSAFKEFTDQLRNVDRNIIVCMVGDHGPYLTGEIAEEPESEETLLLRTSVPFVIWANYDIEDRSGIDGQTISMNYLVPALLNIAKVKMTPYYDYMLDLKNEVPILTAYGGYYDRFGNSYSYDSASEHREKVNAYLYLEYNNLQDDREQSLFDAY